MVRIGWVSGLLALLVGCESGLATVVDLEVDHRVARAYAADAPGVLVTDAGGVAEPLLPMCGDPVEPFTYVNDHGFGCLADAERGTAERLRAWIRPLPAHWDAAAFCALERSDFGPLLLPEEVAPAATDTGAMGAWGDDALGPPEADWPQGVTRAEWHAVPICGGVLRGDPLVIGP